MPNVILSKRALLHNVRRLKEKAGDRKIMAVLKSEAYGYGLIQAYADLCNEPSINGFAVSNCSDAMRLVESPYPVDKPIFILNPVRKKAELYSAMYKGLILSIGSREHMDTVIEFLKWSKGKPLKVWVEMKTSLNRFGCSTEDLDYLMTLANTDYNVSSRLLVLGAFSQPSAAGLDSKSFKHDSSWVEKAKEYGIDVSCSNSAAVLVEELPCDWVRPGVALFGNTHITKGVPNGKHFGLEQTQMLTAEIMSIHNVTPGQNIGYSNLYTVTQKGKVAVLDVGYANGLPARIAKDYKMRVFDKQGQAKSLGAGSMFMNNMIVDITDVVDPKVGDTIVMYGDPQSRADVLAYCSAVDVNQLTVGAYYSGLNAKAYRNLLTP